MARHENENEAEFVSECATESEQESVEAMRMDWGCDTREHVDEHAVAETVDEQRRCPEPDD